MNAAMHLVTMTFRVRTTCPDALDAHLDGVLRMLNSLGMTDADLGGSLTRGEIDVSMAIKSRAGIPGVCHRAVAFIKRAVILANGQAEAWECVEIRCRRRPAR